MNAMPTLEEMNALERLAERLFKAKAFPDTVRSVDTAFAILLKGWELGMPAMAAAAGIAIVSGKVSLGADATAGACLRHRDICLYFSLVESTAELARYETQRAGAPKPVTLTYTIAQAKAAGLTGSSTWQKHPPAMLRARCAAALARAVYPDLVAGCYDPDEAAEIRGEYPRAVEPAPVAAPSLAPLGIEAPAAAPLAFASPGLSDAELAAMLAMLSACETIEALDATRAEIRPDVSTRATASQRATLRAAAEARRAALSPTEPTDPPAAKRRKASPSVDAAGDSAPTSRGDGPAALVAVPAWMGHADAMRAHLAGLGHGRAVEASVRKHGRHSRAYRDLAAQRVEALTPADADGARITLASCLAAVERWAAEGPRERRAA